MIRRPPKSPLFPCTPLFRSLRPAVVLRLVRRERAVPVDRPAEPLHLAADGRDVPLRGEPRSEEHTSELQSRQYLVCRLLLEKKQLFHINTVDAVSPRVGLTL